MTNEEQGAEAPLKDKEAKEVHQIIMQLRKNFPVEPIPMIALLNFMVMELIRKDVREGDFLLDVSRCWMYHEIFMKETDSKEEKNENG